MWLIGLVLLFVAACIIVPGICSGGEVYENRDENPSGL